MSRLLPLDEQQLNCLINGCGADTCIYRGQSGGPSFFVSYRNGQQALPPPPSWQNGKRGADAVDFLCGALRLSE